MALTIALIGEDNLTLTSLCQQLRNQVNFRVENKVYSFDEAFQFLRNKTIPILAVVDLSRDPEKAFQVAEKLKFELPNIHLLMTSHNTSPETILRAMRSGAEEFFTQPFNYSEVLKSLERVSEKINLHSAKNVKQGQIVTVYSSKGGVGTTTVATNLAVALRAQKQKSVCIVDLALQFGSVTSFLNLEAPYTILDFVKNIERIDPLFLDGSLVGHNSGVKVLAEPFDPEDAEKIAPPDIEKILDILVQAFDFVIVDCPKEFNQPGFLALRRASLILFVTTMDIHSLKSAHRVLELFERMDIGRTKVRLIMNRYAKSKILILESVEKALGIKVFWMLPDDYPTAIAAVNQGLSILEGSPKSAIAKGYQDLAQEVAEAFSSPLGEKTERKENRLGTFSPRIPIAGRA
jgi:pilus assembly protein CpaE